MIRKVYFYILIVAVYLMSYFLMNMQNAYYDVSSVQCIKSNFLITYLAGFVAFLLAVYTMCMSVLKDIVGLIYKSDFDNEEKRNLVIDTVMSSFSEMKSGIMFFMFFFLVVVFFHFIEGVRFHSDIVNMVIKKSISPLYTTIFVVSVLIIYDLLGAMFGISEVLMLLIRINKKNENIKEK